MHTTVDEMVQVVDIWNRRRKADGYTDENSRFAVCHIAPAKHDDVVGLVHPANLVIACKRLNQSHGNSYFGNGKAINRVDIDPTLDIPKGTSKGEVLTRLIELLGTDYADEVCRKANIQKSSRDKLLVWLRNHIDEECEKYGPLLGGLDSLSQDQLTALKADIADKPQGRPPRRPLLSVQEVYRAEIERLATVRDDLANLHDDLTGVMQYRHMPLDVETTLFAVLHGKSLSGVGDSLTNWLWSATPNQSKWILHTVKAEYDEMTGERALPYIPLNLPTVVGRSLPNPWFNMM